MFLAIDWTLPNIGDIRRERRCLFNLTIIRGTSSVVGDHYMATLEYRSATK